MEGLEDGRLLHEVGDSMEMLVGGRMQLLMFLKLLAVQGCMGQNGLETMVQALAVVQSVST